MNDEAFYTDSLNYYQIFRKYAEYMKIMQRGLYDVKCNQCKAKPLIMRQLDVVYGKILKMRIIKPMHIDESIMLYA